MPAFFLCRLATFSLSSLLWSEIVRRGNFFIRLLQAPQLVWAMNDPYLPPDVRSRLVRFGVILPFITVIGTVGYVILEGWSFTDALYMTVITLSTVGFGEGKMLAVAKRYQDPTGFHLRKPPEFGVR